MKKNNKPDSKRAVKRDLFSELIEGMVGLAEARQSKRTLRTHTPSDFKRSARSKPAA
jgi:hypothetical protein